MSRGESVSDRGSESAGIRIALQDWRRAGRRESILGKEIFWRDSAGGGPVVLMIHGFPTASWDWSWIWDDLAVGHRLVAPDLLGFGFSAKPVDHDYSIHDQADRCEALLDELDVGDFHVLAHDYGDTVAQELLARRNEDSGAPGLRSVLFLNGGLFPEAHRPRPIQRWLHGPLGPLLARLMTRRGFARSFSAVFGPQTPPSSEELDAFWSLIRRDGGRRVIPKLLGYMPERKRCRARWVGALAEAAVPIGLVDGWQDPVSGRHLAERFRESFGSRAFVVDLPEIGHYPQVEAPGAVIGAWRRFAQFVEASES